MRIAKTFLAPATGQKTTTVPPAPHPAPARSSPATATGRAMRDAREAMSVGDHASALRAFDAALEGAPQLSIAHLGRAVCLFALGQDQDGRVALDDALATGQDGEALLMVARACASMGREGLAMDLVALALAAFPDAAPRIADDAGFVNLRDHPRFLQLVGRL